MYPLRLQQRALGLLEGNSLGNSSRIDRRTAREVVVVMRTPSTRQAKQTTLETLHRRGVRARLHVLLPLQADLVLLRDEVRHHEERLLLARLRQ